MSSYRALTYAHPGKNIQSILRLTSHAALGPPASGTANVKFLLSPINPADINVLQGVYPVKAQTQLSNGEWVGGNEGVAQVVDSSSGDLSPGDWVVPITPQLGTWRSSANIHLDSLVRVPRSLGLLRAASSTVNPPTALCMLQDARPQDWVLQTTANSGVGEAVIQIAQRKGIKTANFVRDKTKLSSGVTVETRLKSLGADLVFSYSELDDPDVRKYLRGLKSKLLLNALSGPDTTKLAKLLSPPGEDKFSPQLVSYGALSMQPLSLPTSLFIFNDLHARGFWMHSWYQNHSIEEREALLKQIAAYELEQPQGRVEEVPKEGDSKEFIEDILGGGGGKVFLKWD